jgi:hypothetical protein
MTDTASCGNLPAATDRRRLSARTPASATLPRRRWSWPESAAAPAAIGRAEPESTSASVVSLSV